MKVLYLSYDGLTDTLGESQILFYTRGLSAQGWDIDIISFEKDHLYKRNHERISDSCRTANIKWHSQTYHKRPPVISTLIDLRQMQKMATRLHKKNNYRLVHCRGYLSGLIGLFLQKRFGIPFIFDMRGFWPDEKKESGDWKSMIFAPIYKFFKNKEKQLFSQADMIISLTKVGKAEIIRNKWAEENKIDVIPTCVNFDLFPPFSKQTRASIRKKLGIPKSALALVYSGSLGGNYNIEFPFTVFRNLLRLYPSSHLIILSRSEPSIVNEFINEENFPDNSIHVQSVPFPEVSQYLMAGDLGLIFYKKGYSNLGRSPTKLGEYWACGLPVLALAGIGDVDVILQSYPGNGDLFDNLDGKELIDTLQRFPFKASKEKMRNDAYDYYSLQKGIDFYHKLYCKLSE